MMRCGGVAQVPEYACHEGNYAMRNILSAARSQEQAQRWPPLQPDLSPQRTSSP